MASLPTVKPTFKKVEMKPEFCWLNSLIFPSNPHLAAVKKDNNKKTWFSVKIAETDCYILKNYFNVNDAITLRSLVKSKSPDLNFKSINIHAFKKDGEICSAENDVFADEEEYVFYVPKSNLEKFFNSLSPDTIKKFEQESQDINNSNIKTETGNKVENSSKPIETVADSKRSNETTMVSPAKMVPSANTTVSATDQAGIVAIEASQQGYIKEFPKNPMGFDTTVTIDFASLCKDLEKMNPNWIIHFPNQEQHKNITAMNEMHREIYHKELYKENRAASYKTKNNDQKGPANPSNKLKLSRYNPIKIN